MLPLKITEYIPCWSISSRWPDTETTAVPSPSSLLYKHGTLHLAAWNECSKHLLQTQGRFSFLPFVLSTERISPFLASSPARIMCYSKLLLQDAVGKLDTPVSSLYNEFSVRNTALATSTGVKRLCRVPRQSKNFFFLFIPAAQPRHSRPRWWTPALVSSS